jgi:hypothetical protein
MKWFLAFAAGLAGGLGIVAGHIVRAASRSYTW